MLAPSKINLFLHVTGRRSDGYHELETLFFPLRSPADSVTLERTSGPGIVLLSDRPDIPTDRRNLCVKALFAFCQAAGIEPEGFAIELKKSIPVAAGMGGGSSDAAAVLLLMQKMFPEKIPADGLAEIALAIGADVPYFLNPVPAVASGIGEKLTPVEGLPEELPILIDAPAFPVSAKWAYKHRIAVPPPAPDQLNDLIRRLRARDFSAAADLMHNDLEEAVFQKFPILAKRKADLLSAGACRVMMTGSGPTLFAMFPSFELRNQYNSKA